ncbi:ribonucleases P/MRP protein subunit POP1 [Cephus cinctus]|uniref:Ribonucleases P/MRP protein subunit POP1 n=1 Tax=Cephus cinctus TaxID=211228 RepID=A0AAJ7FKH6_CEPCN|nr:ribonucleases P/MRP protein subunit POP1 [Cephus cinctus]
MDEKKQFDKFLGGEEELPRDVPMLRLVASRASEIAAMNYSIENPQQTKLIFQKLPVHMRRRIMSHNAKRMPRRLREAHTRQMAKSGLPPKNKRPSRKYRRRPRNLLLEYNRRQRDKVWLETHIWHAKRFHMTEKWGYKIPNFPNDRCFRANYRAIAKHCLIQDISYYSCIEITGPLSFLIDTLKRHCNTNELTFGAKVYLSGTREGNLMFYKEDGYPKFPIGNVNFLWKPPDDSLLKTIWIWVHPCFYTDFISAVIASFKFELNSLQTDNMVDISETVVESERNDSKIIAKKKAAVENNCFSKHVEYHNGTNCTMILLNHRLNRFRLCGPLALDIITNALRLPNLELIKELPEQEQSQVKTNVEEETTMEVVEISTEVDTESKESSGTTAKKSWFNEYHRKKENIEYFKVQQELFDVLKDLKSPNQLPPNIVIALTVLDPRFFMPQTRTRSERNNKVSDRIPMPPTLANRSPIWESDVRKFVETNLKSTTQINKLRSKNLVPGVSNDDNYNENIISKIPILLLQRPGCFTDKKCLGFTSAIDIIIPAGWAMPFWLSFILRCARPGGLKESKSIILENLDLNSPNFNSPDTSAYVREALNTKLEMMERYFRYPPNRRVNFVKLGISSPFYCEWKILMREWTDMDDFYVLRNKNLLSHLETSISNRKSMLGKNKNRKGRKFNVQSTITPLDKTLFPDDNCLIPVKISIEKRGCPKNFSVICLPSTDDLKNYENNNNWSGPVQSIQKDPNENKRKLLRRGHLAILKRLRRQRVRRKRKLENRQNILQEKGSDINLVEIMKRVRRKTIKPNRGIIEKQAQVMSSLYLPKCTKVKNSCDREVMGYVVQGDFSFTESKGIGLGYVVLPSLFSLTDKGNNIVLVRNTTTRQYRIARLEILIT